MMPQRPHSRPAALSAGLPLLVLLITAAASSRSGVLGAAAASPPAAVELSSSALMFYSGDVVVQQSLGGLSLCELLVRRAAAHGGRRVQLVPTHYWVDKHQDAWQDKGCNPDNLADANLAVRRYCHKQAWDSPGCSSFSRASINEFSRGLQQCFATALSLFEEVLIAPHLDPAAGDTSTRPKWRNMLRFDPLEKDETGYSYNDVMLQPILTAALAAFKQKPGKTFWFGMGGEMGGTITNHPAAYSRIISGIRAAWQGPARLLTGVTFFSSFLPGQVNRGPGPLAPLNSGATGKLEGGYGPLLPLAQWPDVARIRAVQADLRSLMAAVDFVGVSNYARAGANPQPADMERPQAIMLEELAAMGVDVAPFQPGGSKLLIWNEFGLGGGLGACNNVSGSGPSDLGLFPWLGVSGAWDASRDPFKRSSAAADYLQRYYAAALSLLSRGGSRAAKVDGAFLWSVGSWDVQGIHTASTNWNTAVAQGRWPVQQGYGNAAVIAAIRDHNARARTSGA